MLVACNEVAKTAPAPIASTVAGFLAAVDARIDPTQSIVLRYLPAVRLETDPCADRRLKELLVQTSLREGLRVIPLYSYRGVQIDVLDETSLMQTGTHKSIDGCVTTAHCLRRGDRALVLESGGNTGSALACYAAHAGLRAVLFVPSENADLLDSRFFHGQTEVFCVDDPGAVKPAAAAYVAHTGLPKVPRLEWRLQSATFVGCFVLEHLISAPRYDILAQSISAAFGPLGIYRVLERFRGELGALPSFFGVQQAANCAMVRAMGDPGGAAKAPPVVSTRHLLARVMYDGRPQTYGTLEPLRRLLAQTAGTLTTLSEEDYTRALALPIDGRDSLSHLASQGIHITRHHGEVLEKAGLMALAGLLRAIDAGEVAPGRRVLVCITGGTADPDGRVATKPYRSVA